MTPKEQIKLSKTRRRSALLISLILHMIVGIAYIFTPEKEDATDTDLIAIEWVKDVPKPQLRKIQNKPPLKMKAYKPDKRLGREAKNKLVESSPHKITQVARISQRIVYENLELNTAAPSEKIPRLMTAAELRDAEASNLERLVSHPGRTDGQGELTGRVRVRGWRNGRFLVDSYGDFRDGILGGGGSEGIADRLGLINYLNEFDGPQQVVYCLDVSASMQAAGLKKLELAIKSIQDSLLMLGDDDQFNIVTFSAHANAWKEEMPPATMDNIEAAIKYLDRFTPARIANNHGTNLLEAMEKSLEINPSILVLVTDGLPTASRNSADGIETNASKILAAVREKNVNRASIYVVGLEIDLARSRGAELLVYLTDQNNGKLKLIDTDQIVRYAQPLGEPHPEAPTP